MNCQEFERRFPDLASHSTLRESAQEEAFNHARNCVRCAARLADERALTNGLSALAREAKAATLPAHLEPALLRAFRGQPNASVRLVSAPADTSRPAAVEPVWVKKQKRQVLAYAGLAACALLALQWIAARHIERSRHVERTTTEAAGVLSGPPMEKALPAVRERLTADAREASPSGAAPKARPRPPRRTQVPQPPTRVAENPHVREVHTAFLPFMAVEPVSPFELQQLVRVRLPRSAVQAFGLPVNMERSREPVEADVLVGEDGRALAVRFVRE